MADITEPQASNTTDQNSSDEMDVQRADWFVKDLNQKLTTEDIKLAFILIDDPKSQRPIIYARGSMYSVAKMLVQMAKHFKAELDKELQI